MDGPDLFPPAGGGCVLRLLRLQPEGEGTSAGQRDSHCRRWSTASRTSPAPSATAPPSASWPSAPAPEPSSCILSLLPAPTQGGPGRGGDLDIGEIEKDPHPPKKKKPKQITNKLQMTLLIPRASCFRDSAPNTVTGGRWWAKKSFLNLPSKSQ